jgi:drug/metabolite transporter (DMT)-like permease
VRAKDVVRLVLLAAIWGGSFLFVRVAVVSLGPMATAEARVALAGATIAAYLLFVGKRLAWRAHWRYYAAVGTINSAAPFALYAWSAQHLPASYLAVINATSPLFGTLVAAAWLGDRLAAHTVIGLGAGLAGVILLVGLGPVVASPAVIAASIAALGAAICYALGSAYVKRRAYAVDAAALAGGSNIAAALVLLPLALASPPPGWPTAEAAWAAVGLGILCTGVAYLLYYRLVTDVGPARALTVTFLIPAFGMLWGAVFLGEPITATMLGGCALVLVGTGLILAPARRSVPRTAHPPSRAA